MKKREMLMGLSDMAVLVGDKTNHLKGTHNGDMMVEISIIMAHLDI